MHKAVWIVCGAAAAVLLACCTPLRHRVNYAIEILSGAHGLSLDYTEKRQSYYRAKFSARRRAPLSAGGRATAHARARAGEKERDPLVADTNPFREEGGKDILVV